MVNERIVALSNQLREEGVTVSIRSTKTACDVWEIMKQTKDKKNLKTALESVYIKDHHDTHKFNKVYDEIFDKEIENEKLKQIRKLSENKDFDPAIKREDFMGLPETVPNQVPLEDIIPKEFNPEVLQQKKIHEKDILQADITSINKFDERIVDLCRKLGNKIANQRIKRKKRSTKNQINMPRTIRTNLKNGGKLINLKKSKPPIRKTKHIFLSDISGSCDWISSWFFSIIYGCQKSFNKITTYEFDNKIVDITDSLNSESYYQTYENIMQKRIDHGMLHGQSDMTNSFKEFLKNAPLNHRTTVIILSDCRDWKGKRENGTLESATILKEIVQRSQKVIIFNPEKKERWETKTSCVNDYKKAGAEVYEIKNLENLSRLITKL